MCYTTLFVGQRFALQNQCYLNVFWCYWVHHEHTCLFYLYKFVSCLIVEIEAIFNIGTYYYGVDRDYLWQRSPLIIRVNINLLDKNNIGKGMQIFAALYNRRRRFRVTQHSKVKRHKVKDGALKMALSPIAICGRVASYWRRGDNANGAVGCYEGDRAAKVDHHSIANPKFSHSILFKFGHDTVIIAQRPNCIILNYINDVMFNLNLKSFQC